MIYFPYFLLRIYGVFKDGNARLLDLFSYSQLCRTLGEGCGHGLSRIGSLHAFSTVRSILQPVMISKSSRLAFVTLSNNLMVLAFRSMFAEFAILMSIAAFCFAGFLYCLWTLVPHSLL
jgi:hypothetical protein